MTHLMDTPTGSGRPGQPAFGETKSLWHGFARYDFFMDAQTYAVEPIVRAADKANGDQPVAGQRRCIVVAPEVAAPGTPWSWRGFYFGHEPQVEVELLKRGFHVCYVEGDADLAWDAWYAFLTERHDLSRTPAFVGMSRGGSNAYTWATANPDKVSCIYADNPAIRRDALMRLDALASNDVPLLHVCGSIDPILGDFTLAIEAIYQQLGGRISVMIQEGLAHHPHSLRDPQPIVDFIVANTEPARVDPPAFVGETFTRTSFYGTGPTYRYAPPEKTYVTTRGPWFAPSYHRYAFRFAGNRVSVIVPNAAAPGMPWVLRADFVTRDETVDLALLAAGFHIVTGPVPTNADGPILEEWNAVYAYLFDHGFSAKPVMEGRGGAAGEAYAWAIANPDKVACVYGENPVLRSTMSEVQPIDHLAPLAEAGVPLLHVCGSLDPWFESQTRVVEARYRALGGKVTVIVNEGVGHYPLAPADPQPVVDWICHAAGVSRRVP